MDLERVKRYLENGGGEEKRINICELPSRFFERFIMQGIKLQLVEPARIVCSIKVHPRLLNGDKYLHGAVIALMVDLVGSLVTRTCGAVDHGVSMEINVSFFDLAYQDEEIEIEARVLRAGKEAAIGVVVVEVKKKKTGNIIAQGRHTIYYSNSTTTTTTISKL